MVRRLCLVFALLFAVPALAEEPAAGRTDQEFRLRLADQVQTLSVHAEGVLRQVELSLLAVGDLITRQPNSDEAVVHAAIRRYADATQGLRAMLVVAADGRLLYDSYTFPAPKLDLSGREYLQTTLRDPTARLLVHPVEIGKTSGVSFVPITRPILDVNGAVVAITVGIMSPDALIPPMPDRCNRCYAAIFLRDQYLIAIDPPGVQMTPDYVRTIPLQAAASGRAEHHYGPLRYAMTWQRANRYPVTSVMLVLEKAVY